MLSCLQNLFGKPSKWQDRISFCLTLLTTTARLHSCRMTQVFRSACREAGCEFVLPVNACLLVKAGGSNRDDRMTESQTQGCQVMLHWTCSCNTVHLPKNLLYRRLSKYIRMIQNDTTLRSFIDKGRSPGASWVSFCHLFFIVESWEVSQKIICLDMLNQLKNHCVPLVTWFGDVRCLSPCDSDPSRLVPFFCCKRPATSSLK